MSGHERDRRTGTCIDCGGAAAQYSTRCEACYRLHLRETTGNRCIDCGIPISPRGVRCRPCRTAWQGTVDDNGEPLPTPEEIAERAAEIRAEWSDWERNRRAGLAGKPRAEIPQLRSRGGARRGAAADAE